MCRRAYKRVCMNTTIKKISKIIEDTNNYKLVISVGYGSKVFADKNISRPLNEIEPFLKPLLYVLFKDGW